MKLNAERIAGIVFLVLGSILFWDNENLRAPAFDLLGSKFFPRITCLAIIILSILLLIFGQETPRKVKGGKKEDPKPALLFIILTIIYLLTLEIGWGFLWTTMGYLTFFIFLMSDFQWKVLPKALGIAVVSSYVSYYFFEKILMLLLP